MKTQMMIYSGKADSIDIRVSLGRLIYPENP
jgi:hypothetical protein